MSVLLGGLINFWAGIYTATGSPTATLLQLRFSFRPIYHFIIPFLTIRRKRVTLKNCLGSLTKASLKIQAGQIPQRDGQCVPNPVNLSPRRADTRLLAIPTSCSWLAKNNPNLMVFRDLLKVAFLLLFVTTIVAHV